MFDAFTSETGEVSRRKLLAYGAQALLGVNFLPAIASLAADQKPAKAKAPAGRATHVIYLCMSGAMSHIDTFDLKPGRETQGQTKAIATSVPGMQFGETLPKLAKLANLLAVVRSLSTRTGDHEGGRYLLQTSNKEIASIRHPAMGAWALKILGKQSDTLPDNVTIAGAQRHPGAGFLEPAFSPVPVADPNVGLQNTVSPKYVTGEAFQKRMQLIDRFDAGFRKKYPQKQVEAYSEYYQQANKLMHSSDLKAFDLSQEKEEVRNKYGRDRFGQGCLLARRLVEHNVRYIEVTLGGWDMHTDIYDSDKLLAKGANLDQAVSSLLVDLKERGLLAKTLVVLGTEFGRSPHVNANGGRDHHPGVFSGFFAGGGIHGGRFYGSSDRDGQSPEDDPVSVPDYNATIAYALGLPLDQEFVSKSGRPFKVAENGKPLVKLFG